MTHVTPSTQSERVRQIADEYARRGYTVTVEPTSGALVIDLGTYRPDLIAEKGNEHLVIEVTTGTGAVSVDRYREIAEEVAAHPGWRFLLITAQDLREREGLGAAEDLPSWDVLRRRLERAQDLRSAGDAEAAYLIAWSGLEGVLRRRASEAAVPVERMPVAPLAKHLYTQGEISAPDLAETLATLDTRNRLVHGFVSSSAAPDAARLESLLHRLLQEQSSVDAGSR